MRVATAKRPVENFATDVVFPERLEDEEALLGEGEEGLGLDENGMPIEGEPLEEPLPGMDEGIEPDPVDEAWVDRAMGRGGEEEGEAPEPKQPKPKTVPPATPR